MNRVILSFVVFILVLGMIVQATESVKASVVALNLETGDDSYKGFKPPEVIEPDGNAVLADRHRITVATDVYENMSQDMDQNHKKPLTHGCLFFPVRTCFITGYPVRPFP